VNRPAPHQVTELLVAWSRGNQAALDQLIPLVAAELHRLAHRYMRREPSGHTLQTTALVNEAYIRLVDASKVEWRDRTHFFAVSAGLMRRILIDLARARNGRKRGGKATRLLLDENDIPAPQPAVDVIALDEALTSLAAIDPRAARIVELRYFGGLTVDETAAATGLSTRTVKREWAAARVWLLQRMAPGGP
jgi:RNA polymerase sigma-70 factor, ECF subfamily